MSKITLDNLSDNLKEYLEGLGLSEEQVLNLINENGLDEEELKTMLKDTMSINELSTNSKTVIGAINELFQSANNGKELIANAIGEPLDASDTFSAMITGINSLLSTFNTNMMNNGITVESGDKFKSLIDKIATLADNEGKGIQYAEGSINNITLPAYTSGFKQYSINLNIDFTPSILMINIGKFIIETTSTYYTANTTINSLFHNSSSNAVVIMSSTETGMGAGYAYISSSNQLYMSNLRYERSVDLENITYLAIGVGEEDTTLRDSLASILTEEGVSVTEEDDMASLITKVDEEFSDKENEISNLETELASKVTPTGDAVAANVLSGKTFINSTGQTITGTMANKGTKTFTPKATEQSEDAGYYTKVSCKGDVNLVAANIVSGKKIFGVTGTATVASLGGKNFASGTCNVTCGSGANTSVSITTNLSFKPSIIILFYTTIKSNQGYGFNGSVVSSENYSADTGHSVEGNWGGATFYITNITSTSFKINATRSTHRVESTYDSTATFTKWFAIG